MPTLLDLQHGFAAAMLGDLDQTLGDCIVDGPFTAAERLRIYRHTFRSTLGAALRITYPAVDRLVGAEFFAAAADAFVRAEAPRSAYLNDYGDGFAAFLASFAPARALPYLPDVARFEWALSVAANAADAPVLAAGALAAVDPRDHPSLRFKPHPSVTVLALSHPADRIADAVLAGDERAMAELDLGPAPVRIVVHRGVDGVEAERLDGDACEFVSRLFAGVALGRLLDGAPSAAPLWLADQLIKGRLQSFEVDVSPRRMGAGDCR